MRFRFALVLATSVALLASCGHEKREVRVTLRDACGLTESADCQEGGTSDIEACGSAHCSRRAIWANLAVFEGGCPRGEALHTGDTNGAARVVTGKAGRALPSIGELEEARHGFAGIFRASDCTIVGTGCTEVDLSDERNVHIDVLPVTGTGACGNGHACEQGICVPSDDATSDDAACIPLLVASGSLPERNADSIASGLGIVATESGYLVGYREDVEGSGQLVRIVPVGKGGAVGTPSERMIEHCAGGSEGGLGMALSGESGLLAKSLASCEGHGAGAAFVSFTHEGTILDAQRFVGAGSDLVLAPSRALAPGRAPGHFELVYVTGGSAYRLGLTGAQPDPSFQALFADTRVRFAQVASTQDVVARLVGSGEAIHLGIGQWETTPRTMSFAGSALASFALHGDRVVVVRSLEGGGMGWEGRTSTGASMGDGSFVTSQSLTALEVLVANGEAIVAAATPSGFFLLPIGDMRGTLAAQPKVIVQHAPASSTHDGRSLAVASIHDRLAIAWLNGSDVDGSVGGYALFECSR